MNGAFARRRPRGARVVPPDSNTRALVIEREVTDDLDRQPWPPTGRRRRLASRSILPGSQANALETHPTRTRAEVTRRA
jgi:hypothetical protein